MCAPGHRHTSSLFTSEMNGRTWGNGKVKFAVARFLYHPVYRALPRPTGDSMFSGLPASAPPLGYDTPDKSAQEGTTWRGEESRLSKLLRDYPLWTVEKHAVSKTEGMETQAMMRMVTAKLPRRHWSVLMLRQRKLWSQLLEHDFIRWVCLIKLRGTSLGRRGESPTAYGL
jgi:hypothetical protein